MYVIEFNNHLNQILEVSKEQKQIFLLGDFNINLLNYNVHQPTNDFLDSVVSNSIIPYILQPARLMRHSKTLIDNIFSNMLSSEIIPRNLTATISIIFLSFYLPLILSQTLLTISQIFLKEIGQNLTKELYTRLL